MHQRAADKLDRFFEAKMKYGRTTGSKDVGDPQAIYEVAQSRHQNTVEHCGSTDRDMYNLMNLRQ